MFPTSAERGKVERPKFMHLLRSTLGSAPSLTLEGPSKCPHALRAGTYASMGSEHSYGARLAGRRCHVWCAEPPLIARGLRGLCVHRMIPISSGPQHEEGRVTRKPAGDPPPPTVLLQAARRGGSCGP
ncbi:hypothetical protein NN561_006248 [Cricetulus griseus]